MAARIVAPRYYAGNAAFAAAMGSLGMLGCRFLVACRADTAGGLLELKDLDIPDLWAGLFEELPARVFRCDLSSTQLRGQPG